MHQTSNQAAQTQQCVGVPARLTLQGSSTIPQHQAQRGEVVNLSLDINQERYADRMREAARDQSRQKRVGSFREAQLKAVNECLKAALILTLSGSNIAFFGFSFSAHPVITTFGTFGLLVGGLSLAYGAQIFRRAWLNRKESLSIDSVVEDPGLNKADTLRAAPDASKEALIQAGESYLKFIGNNYGATLNADALVGLHDCLIRMGCCPESAILLSRVGVEMASKYEGLPIQQELMAFALANARGLYEALPDNELRLELAESMAKLAYAGAMHDRPLAVATAEKLHELARELPPGYVLIRAHLLEAAYDLTKPADLIRENVTSQLQEISDQCLHSPSLLGRSRRELSKILNRTGTET